MMGKRSAARSQPAGPPKPKRKRTSSPGATQDGHDANRQAPDATIESTVTTEPRIPSSPTREYSRIQLRKVSAKMKKRQKHVEEWEVLIPSKGALSLSAAALPGTQRTTCKLCPLGALFPTAELAARAADRALIAMSGRLSSESLLNWPLDEYPETECHQRFGADLARYMLDVVHQGQAMMGEARGRSRTSFEEELIKEDKRVVEKAAARLLRDNPMYTFHQKPCGLCRPCRHPELAERCIRAQMNTYGYKPRDHALLDAEGVEKRAFREAIAAAKASSNRSLRERLVNDLGEMLASHATTDQICVEDQCMEKKEERMVDRESLLHWLVEPAEVAGHSSSSKASHKIAPNADIVERITKEISEVKRVVLSSTKKRAWECPMSAFPKGNQHEAILASRRLAARESAELVEVPADNPVPTPSIARRCRWCGEKHHGSRSQKHCAFLQVALAMPSSTRACQACQDAPNASCSTCLRGNAGLPPEVLALSAPLRGGVRSAEWARRLPPAMLDLVLSIRNLASAAVSDFRAEHLTAQLTPNALLALGMIAEAMIDDAIEQEQRKKPR